MIPSAQPLRVNDDLVAAEIVDGEAVIINLGNGMYYTMDRVGAEAWQLIEGRHSTEEMAVVIAARYGLGRDAVLSELESVVAELMAEGLVVIANETSAVERAPVDLPPAAGPYAKPAVTRYTDMSEVLALDPPLPELRTDRGSKP